MDPLSLLALGGGAGNFLGGVANLFGAGGEGGDWGKVVEIINKLQTTDPADLERGYIDPGDLAMVARVAPALYDAYVPDEIKQAADSPEMRAAQMQGLERLRTYATEGYTPADRAMMEQGMGEAQMANRRMQESTLQNLAQRGRLGGGAEIEARLAAQQPAAQLGRDMSTAMMQDMANRRYAAAGAYSGLAGNIRGQDVAQNQFNAQTINNANQLYAQMINEARARNQQMEQQAQMYNAATQQAIANANVDRPYQEKVRSRAESNALAQIPFQQNLAKTQLLAGAQGQYEQSKDYDKAAREATIKSLAGGLGMAGGGIAGLAGGGTPTGGNNAARYTPENPWAMPKPAEDFMSRYNAYYGL